MKLTCTQENLSKGLNVVARLSEKTPNLPILSNVLLQATKDGLTLTATNLELGITTKIRGKIDTEGEFTVSARLIADFVNSLKKENVSIELEEKILHIKGENHQTTIRGLDAVDFPVIPVVADDFTIQAEAGDIRDALHQIVFSMSMDDSRPELNGAFFQFGEKELIIASTDSYRLSERVVMIVNKTGKEKNVIVPARTVSELLRIIDADDSKEVSVRVNDNQIMFIFGETEIVSRIVTGNYPDYKQIIPNQFTNNVDFSVSDMIQAIKTTSLFCKQGINDVRISLDKRFDDIAIHAENSIFGKNVSNVKSMNKGQEMDIVFNYKFLLDGLQHLHDVTATLKTNDGISPALLTSKKDENFVYVIMPIRQ